MATDTDVLIVGAGPTGLVLALFLTRLGVRVRIIDKTQGPGTTSRALVLHARTLEFYEQVGLANACVEGGVKFAGVNLWVNGSRAARAKFDDLGAPFSRFSFILVYPQDKQEQLLVAQLAHLGVNVERETELVSFELRDEQVNAVLKKKSSGGAAQSCSAAYIAGCDGAHSKVREKVSAGFPGGDYGELFYVADIIGAGATMNGEVNVALDEADFLIVFPMKERGSARLVGVFDPGQRGDPRWEDVSKRIIDDLKLRVDSVRWFSTYRVHHRVAASFRKGRAFLLGDAAHIHSPVGGQGMNTGIGDAVNLAWKLAAVIGGRLDPAMLDSYQAERITFARRLVATTDRAFSFVTARGSLAKRIRLTIVPIVIPRLFAVRAIRRFLFRILSQLGIRYPKSALSAGKAGHLHGGDRLPWVPIDNDGGQRLDNFEGLKSLDWELHCYGALSARMRALCERRSLNVREYAWRKTMKQSGFQRNAIYLIRPDGYIGLAEPHANPAVLERYLDVHKVRTSGAMK